jgi:hypothetical protein
MAVGTALVATRRRPSARAYSWWLVAVLTLDLGYLLVGYPLLSRMSAPHTILCPGDPGCIEGQFDSPFSRDD